MNAPIFITLDTLLLIGIGLFVLVGCWYGIREIMKVENEVKQINGNTVYFIKGHKVTLDKTGWRIAKVEAIEPPNPKERETITVNTSLPR